MAMTVKIPTGHLQKIFCLTTINLLLIAASAYNISPRGKINLRYDIKSHLLNYYCILRNIITCFLLLIKEVTIVALMCCKQSVQHSHDGCS